MSQDVAVKVLLDRLEIARVHRLRVERTTGLEADVFEAAVANPAQEYTAAFRETEGKRVELRIRGAVSFTGFCDSAGFPMVPRTLVTVEGRDWTGIAIDEVMDEGLAARLRGKTASQVSAAIAEHFGWASDVDATTRVYGDYKAFVEGLSAWEVIRDLAGKEGFDAYVTPEKVLVFKRRSLPEAASRVFAAPPAPGRNPEGQVPSSLEFFQDKTLTLALKVKVIGYDEQAKRRVVYTAESKLRNRPNYRLVTITDLALRSKAEVRARAEAELVAVSKDLTTGELVVPVDEELAPGQAIAVRGCGRKEDGGFDDRYFVTSVVHQQEPDGEFTSSVRFASKPLVTSRDITVGEEE